MPHPDGIRLKHMRDAILMAARLSAGREQEQLATDPSLALSLVRCLDMVAMRNRLIHAYFDVDLNVVWTTVTEDLPAVLPSVERAIAALEA